MEANKVLEQFRAAIDPSALMEKMGKIHSDLQQEILLCNDRQILLCCCRQFGKSTLTSVKAVHLATNQANSGVLILAPSLHQSQLLFKKCKQAYNISPIVPIKRENQSMMEFANGSFIECVPCNENTGRGYGEGLKMIIFDESQSIPDDDYFSVKPAASTGARILVMGTPKGKRGWFANAFHDKAQKWTRFTATCDQAPWILPEVLEEAKKENYERFMQEYMIEWISSMVDVFDIKAFDRCTDKDDDYDPLEAVA